MWLMLCAWRWTSAPPGEANRCESHKSIPTIGKQNMKKRLFFRVGVLSALRYLSQLCLASQWKFIKVFAVQWIRLIFRHIYYVHCLELLGGIKIGSKSAINKYSLGRKYWKTIAQTFRASVESCFEANWSWPSCGYILPANITTRAASSWVSERRRSCICKLVSLSFFWNIFVTSILLIFSRVLTMSIKDTERAARYLQVSSTGFTCPGSLSEQIQWHSHDRHFHHQSVIRLKDSRKCTLKDLEYSVD